MMPKDESYTHTFPRVIIPGFTRCYTGFFSLTYISIYYQYFFSEIIEFFLNNFH